MLKYLLAIAIILLFIILKSINKLKNKVGILFILKTILIVLFLEVTVFNINSYRTDLGKLKYIDFYGDELNQRIEERTDGSRYINLDNLNTKIKSISKSKIKLLIHLKK